MLLVPYRLLVHSVSLCPQELCLGTGGSDWHHSLLRLPAQLNLRQVSLRSSKRSSEIFICICVLHCHCR